MPKLSQPSSVVSEFGGAAVSVGFVAVGSVAVVDGIVNTFSTVPSTFPLLGEFCGAQPAKNNATANNTHKILLTGLIPFVYSDCAMAFNPFICGKELPKNYGNSQFEISVLV